MRKLAVAIVLVIGLVGCGDDEPEVDVRSDESAPATDMAWRPIPAPPGPVLTGGAAVWTGTQLVVWGGHDQDRSASDAGYALDTATDTWTELPAAPLSGRSSHTAVWTGREVIVWGGAPGMESAVADGAAFDPAAGTWRTIAAAPIPARMSHEAVWDGDEMIVWGGFEQCCPIDSVIHRVEAAAYDPASDTWRRLPDVPEPWSGDDGAAVTTAVDGELFVWRRDHLGTNVDDGWREVAPQPALPERTAFTTAGPFADGGTDDGQVLVWTGEWDEPLRGLAYDPATDTWTRLADVEVGEWSNVATRAGGAWLATGGVDADVRVQRYDRATDAWNDVPAPPLDAQYVEHVLDIGDGLVLLGGYDGQDQVGRGAIYSPAQVMETTKSTTSTSTSAPTTTTSIAVPAALDVIDAGGIGPIRAGMTVAEAQGAAGVTITPSEFDTFGRRCWYGDVEGQLGDFSLLIVAPTDEPAEDPLAGIIGRATGHRSDRGVGMDSTADEVRAAYADATIEESHHEYVDGLYLDVRSGDDGMLLRFETDGDLVTAVHGGLEEQVRYPEGCA